MDNTYILRENICTEKTQGRYETVMCQGNGYLGIRGAFCENVSSKAPLTLVAGLYDKQPCEEEEIMPLPDVTMMTIKADDIELLPLNNTYSRSLDTRNGLMEYGYSTEKADITQRRFVSMANKHLVAFETVIRIKHDTELSFESAINARMTVLGTQHTLEEARTVLDGDLLYYGGRAAFAGTRFCVGSRTKLYVNGHEQKGVQRYATTRRHVSATAKLALSENDEVRAVRYALVYTEHDSEWVEDIQNTVLENMNGICKKDFDSQLAESESVWKDIWNNCDIELVSEDESESLKIRLAIYHMIIMCPRDNEYVSIAAKGLTSMGYAGRVFWDCEIFNLPFFYFTDTAIARNLCIYRYHTLNGAREKARKYGYRGAMYPWESASASGEEQCPRFKNYSPDNTPRRVTCGDIEHHVVCDVAYGIYSYYKTTGDREYMERYGYEILFSTADFWQSRLEYKNGRYEICSVTGPDEYKEFVDNDVFTNYMAEWNMRTAAEEIKALHERNIRVYEELDSKIGLGSLLEQLEKKLPLLYLPKANKDGLIPQNDTYLTLEPIDIAEYKNSGINRLIYRDYSLSEIGKLMVSKQADLIQLMALMPDRFDRDILKKNFDFYEDRCIHDSSLSLSAFALVATKLGDADFAHKFFRGALDTDFGENATLCFDGIHAANCGGIWQTAVFGFMGVRLEDGVLYISPCLPKKWASISAKLCINGSQIKLTITQDGVNVELLKGKNIQTVVNVAKGH